MSIDSAEHGSPTGEKPRRRFAAAHRTLHSEHTRKKSKNMRDAIRDDGSIGSPATPRDAIDPLMGVRSSATSFDAAQTPGGAGTHPEFRGDLAVEALFQMFVDIGDRKRVD
jgi:hypothetical protein